MAKSKTGGTRAYIRGRVGSDVYSIGRDAKGDKQQVVRSLAEAVANPQTLAQMRGRMIMSTLMQAKSAFRVIVDHSFDNVTGVMPNLSEFVSRNYALIKADVANHSSENNIFGLNMYKEKGVKRGAYILSFGSAIVPTDLRINTSTGVLSIVNENTAPTFAQLKALLGMTSDDYFTLVGVSQSNVVEYCRIRFSNSMADDTVLSASNIDSAFAMEGNKLCEIAFDNGDVTFTLADVAGNCGLIVSRSVNGGYIHNECQLSDPENPSYAAEIALPTYPVGEQKFLNGGDIFGLDETTGGGSSPSPEPQPEVVAPVVSSLSLDGSNVSIGGNWGSRESGARLSVTISNFESIYPQYQIGQSEDNVADGGNIALQDPVTINGATTQCAWPSFEGSATMYCYIISDGKVVQKLGLYQIDPED